MNSQILSDKSLRILLPAFLVFISQSLFPQEKVDTAAMRESKSIHQLEWEKHKELQSEKTPQFEFSLSATDTNPFNLEKTIKYELSSESEVCLQVYTAKGKKIKTLTNGPTHAGAHQIIWDCDDDIGQPAASGIYIVVLVTKPENSSIRFRKMGKILVIR
jgi:FlgD Ig-like domain